MNRKLSSTIVSMILLALAPLAQADPVDDFIEAEMQRQRIPGLSLAIVKDGNTIKIQGYGLANVESNVAAKPDTVYKIGSISKQFIATGVMLLVADGKLSIEDKINKYLEGAPDTWKEITIRHLLTHTSGLQRESPDFDPRKIQSDADLIKAGYPQPLRFAPGDKYEYCNLGYFILAELIHKISGKSWPDYIAERVFLPLGMTASRATTLSDLVPNRANGYALRNDKLENVSNWIAVRPSGAFLSSVLDLAKWEAALYSNKILKQSTRNQMWTPVTLNNGMKHPYGFGWQLDDYRGIPMIQHGGTLNGFRAQYTRFPGNGLTVIVLTNLESANVNGIAKGVATKYLADADLLSLQPQPSPDPEMTKLFTTLMGEVADGSKDMPQAIPELRENLGRLPAASRSAMAARLKQQTSFDFLRRRDVSGKGFQRFGVPIANIWHYRLVTPERTYYYTFYLTPEKKVALLEASTL